MNGAPGAALDLLTLQAEALYLYDDAGRLLRVSGPGDHPAPRFFLGQTLEGNLWRCRHDLPLDLIRELEATASAEPVSSDLRALPRCHDRLRTLLETHAPIGGVWHGPAYRFPDAPLAAPVGVARIDAANADLLRPNFSDWIAELDWSQPCLAVVEGGVAVSICISSRNHLQAAEAGVETHEAARGRGYAARVVAAWGAAVREEGRVPLYSTSWDNVASRGVARRLRLELYGTDFNSS